MPTKSKTVDNMTKHLTKAEAAARQEAEASVMPTRIPKKPPRYIKSKSRERQIWDKVLDDMAGYDILDLLDADTLGLYCCKLVRWEELAEERADLRTSLQSMRSDPALMDAAAYTAGIKTLTAISAELQSLEGGILTYATRLGLTPDSRARLARRIADQQAADDDDLFAP